MQILLKNLKYGMMNKLEEKRLAIIMIPIIVFGIYKIKPQMVTMVF